MRLFLSILLFLFISIASASAQNKLWLPVGDGLPMQGLRAVVAHGNLYVLHMNRSDAGYGFAISRWNEVEWTRIADFIAGLEVTSFEAYKGDLYVGGIFDDVNDIPGTRGIAKWDGTAWQSVGGGLGDSSGIAETVYDMIEYKGDLYCTGEFASVAGIEANHIARWDGTRWSAVEDGIDRGADWGQQGLAFAVYRGDLYVGGNFGGVDGIPASCIARWNGKSWSAAGDSTIRGIERMLVYKDELYAVGSFAVGPPGTARNLMRWNGAVWDTVPTPQQYLSIRDWDVYNGEIYVGGRPAGISTGNFDGTRWEGFPGFDANVAFLIVYRGNLYAGGQFTKSKGTPTQYIARLCDETNCGMISGTVYHDTDGNCTIDSDDPGLVRRIIKVTPGPYYVTSKADGSYAQYVLSGTYDVTLVPRDHWNQVCPMASTGYNVTIATGDDAREKNFGLQPVPNIRDVRVSVVAGRARPGTDFTYAITYENVGTMAAGGTIRFQHDPALTFIGSAPPQARSAGNIIEWDFTDLAIDESRTITVTMRVPQTTLIGTAICGSIEADLDLPDLRAHHRDTFCIEVTGSYDPNDISVAPFGIEKNGEITREDSILTYTVRFQNTGNDTAFKVVVVDTLSSHLDVATITPGAASHPFTFAIDGRGIVTWTFENILLPDSGASEPNSHGFFKYTIHQRKGLASGTRIPNRVEIYFDYNAPVATNTVISVIGSASSVPAPVDPVDVMVYPNPAKEMLHLRGMIGDDARIELRDLLGNRLEAAVERAGEDVMIDLRGVPSGTYFVAIATKHGTVLRRITIAR